MKDRPVDEYKMSARVFKRGKSIAKGKRKIQTNAIIFVLVVIIVILCVLLFLSLQSTGDPFQDATMRTT